MGVLLSAGGSFRWHRDALCGHEKEIATQTGRDIYEMLTEQAARAPAGCEGLLFLPYLTGERTPYPDPNARGAFIGLTVRHTKAHLTRAVMEGVGYGLRDSLELLRALGITATQVRASGGGARSALWRQILAEVFDAEIVTVNVGEGAAFGAALLAGVGAGVYRDVASACETVVKVKDVTKPSTAKSVYARFYPRYRALYPALKRHFTLMLE
jgi:xylulokinase